MTRFSRTAPWATLLVAAVASPAFAQGVTIEPPQGERIAWFGTLQAGMAEAERTRRPILFTSARPECRGVPGFW
ncbi:hypothetical protein OAX78_02265 [Planctomycetota bacterium]|nr:hypothetical protein [Planctomycetota bacterium]